MSFPRYPSYKDSTAEWIACLPSHWDVTRLKRRVASTNAGEVIDKSYWGGEDELLYTCAIEPMWSDFHDFPDWKRTTTHDLLLTRNGTPYIHKPVEKSIYTNVVQRITLTNPLERDFLALAAQSAANNLQGYGVSIESLNYGMWSELLIPAPPLEEALLIASFIDRETAKIDALITEKQRLIELLQEKRQAVISHAVTKGLNPNAPLKDSGVEWLGEVPEHWKVKRMKHLCKSIEQGWSPQCESEPSDGDAPGVLKVGCVNGGVFRPAENKKLPPDLAPIPQYSVKKGDLLVSRANTKELVGSAAAIEEDFPWLYICDKLYRITVKTDLSTANYLCLYLASSEARGEIELGASGASPSMQNISQSVLLDLPVPLPQTEEQERICSAIAIQCALIDELTAKATDAIRLFQERRSALISAAVTGQIDVRGMAQEVAA